MLASLEVQLNIPALEKNPRQFEKEARKPSVDGGLTQFEKHQARAPAIWESAWLYNANTKKSMNHEGLDTATHLRKETSGRVFLEEAPLKGNQMKSCSSGDE